jgi:carboxypeptidase PM20D1
MSPLQGLILGSVLGGLLLVLVSVVIVRAARVKKRPPLDLSARPTPRDEGYAKTLQAMIALETVSSAASKDLTKFYAFQRELEVLFPHIAKALERKDFSGSLLWKWKGQEKGAGILLLNHFDVVEATKGWKHDPFAGTIEDGLIYGRGALDDKGPLFAMLEAVEESLEEGYVPRHDVYLASSATEEIGGQGGPAMAAYLRKEGVRFRFLIDEGGAVVAHPFPFLGSTYAMVGTVEKGCGDLRIIARGKGGHASAPGKGTPLVRLGGFMADLEKHYPFQTKLSPSFKEMIRRFSPDLPFRYRLVTENLWLFGPLVKQVVLRVPQLAAMNRTTIAFTMAQGSEGYNVLPQEASVVANVRYIQHQPNDVSLALLRKIARKYALEIEVLNDCPPSPRVDSQGEPFRIVEAALKQIYPGVVVTPYVMTGNTDARFYSLLTDNGLRIAPLLISADQMGRIHGGEEAIAIASLGKAVDFYKEILKKA